MEQTTMQVRHQNFMWAVRREMGWPAFKPINDCLAFSSGRPLDFEIGAELGRLAQAMRKDMIYSGWSSATAREPSGFTVVIRELLSVDIVDRVLPWAADDHSPIVLVSTRGDEVFAVGKRGLLERMAGKPPRLAEGRKRAMKRIRAAIATMSDEVAENNVWLPAGAPWVEPDQPLETVIRFN